jgi:ferredoxin
MTNGIPTATFIHNHDADQTSIAVLPTVTLREAAHEAGVPVRDRCGGMGACCSCVVTVISGSQYICPKTDIEEAVFYLALNDRLSCQCTITGPVVIKV